MCVCVSFFDVAVAIAIAVPLRYINSHNHGRVKLSLAAHLLRRIKLEWVAYELLSLVSFVTIDAAQSK